MITGAYRSEGGRQARQSQSGSVPTCRRRVQWQRQSESRQSQQLQTRAMAIPSVAPAPCMTSPRETMTFPARRARRIATTPPATNMACFPRPRPAMPMVFKATWYKISMRISRVAGLLLTFPLPGLFCQTLFLVPGKAPSSTMPSGAVAFHVKSAADSPVVLHVDVKDAAGEVSKATLKLRVRGDAVVAVPLNSPDPLEMGMRGP